MRDPIPKPPRRKPSQQRSRDVAAAIRTAAAQVLVERGYARATTNRIAEVAGVSIGTVYQYYDGKDAIFDELADHFLGAVTASVIESASATHGLPLEARARALAEAGAGVVARHPGLLRALDAAPGTSFRPKLHAARHRAREVLERIFAGDGRIDADVRRRARLYTAMSEGVALDIEPGDDVAWIAESMARILVEHVGRR